MVNRLLWALLVALAVAVLVVVAVKLRPLLTPEPVLLAVPDPDCDLRAGPCTGRFAGGGEVTLDLEPRGIPPARPLVLRVLIRDLVVSAVALDLTGTDMDMGYNRRILGGGRAGALPGRGDAADLCANPYDLGGAGAAGHTRRAPGRAVSVRDLAMNAESEKEDCPQMNAN